jgi:hypothetical protein
MLKENSLEIFFDSKNISRYASGTIAAAFFTSVFFIKKYPLYRNISIVAEVAWWLILKFTKKYKIGLVQSALPMLRYTNREECNGHSTSGIDR